MDIHKKYTVYALMDEGGKIIDQGRVDNQPVALAQMVAKRAPVKVVMEATCNWYYFHDPFTPALAGSSPALEGVRCQT
jgi:hypothetical protein